MIFKHGNWKGYDSMKYWQILVIRTHIENKIKNKNGLLLKVEESCVYYYQIFILGNPT